MKKFLIVFPMILAVAFGVALTVMASRRDNRDHQLVEEIERLKEENHDLRAKLLASASGPDPELIEIVERRGEAATPAEARPGEVEEAQSPTPAARKRREKRPMPTDADGWFELMTDESLSQEELAKAFLGAREWFESDPTHILELVDLLSRLDNPELADLIGGTLSKAARGNPEAQVAMLDLLRGSAPDAAKASTLDALRDILRGDPLAKDRLTDADLQMISMLALRSDDDAVRAQALGVLDRMGDDAIAQQTFVQAWKDPTLDERGRRYTLHGLRYQETEDSTAILLDALTGDYEERVREEASQSLLYMNPVEQADKIFNTIEPNIYTEEERDMQYQMLIPLARMDNQRTAGILRNMQSRESDPWEREKLGAVAKILDRESDWVKIMEEGRQTIQELDARREQQESGRDY